MEKYQASILVFLLECLQIDENVDSLEFSLVGEFSGKYHVAHSAIKSINETARVVFTLPNYSQSVFVALTRSNPKETARLLANLEDYERGTGLQLSLGEVVITPDQAADSMNTPFAMILLRTATSLDCAQIPDTQLIIGKQTFFFLVVPLTKKEWELRRQYGHDALMDKFEVDQKELFF